jgi:tetratricopeptide (TPR) repeat protein
MRVLLAPLLAAAVTAAASSQTVPPAPSPGRVDLLAAWLEAVDRHQPGRADESTRTVGAWSGREMALLREHLPTVVSLIRSPGIAIFFRRQPGTTRTRQVFYTVRELNQLRALASRHGAVSASDACARDEGRQRPGFNAATRLLKRVAMLHLDQAAIRERRGSPVRADGSFMLQVNDGQSLGQFGVAGHVELARDALNQVTQPCSVRPEPAKDGWVRDWYLASLTMQLSHEQYEVAHVERAVELFRDDADILALGGAVHESLAAPQMQAPLGDDRVLRDRLRVRETPGQLGRSEDLLRRALQHNDALVEPRIRLGNVLGLRGKHVEAARELERAVAGARENRLLAYYARMLHGRELEASGDRRSARTAYEQAQRLFPAAQAPQLALSQLLKGAGDAAMAVSILDRLVQPSNQTADDPWWSYHSAAGRSIEQRFRVIWAATPAPVMP